MVRSDLIRCLCEQNPDLTASETERIVDLFFGKITEQLAAGGRIELRGFGVFEARARDARSGRNPKSGAAVPVPAKRIPFFKAGKTMRTRINLNRAARTD